MLAALALALAAGCSAPRAIDLLHENPPIDRRPSGDAVRIDRLAGAGDALVIRAPARVTWAIRFPRQSMLHASVALLPSEETPAPGVVLRLGISNDRVYEIAGRLPIDAAGAAQWRPMDVDLSAYSGWRFAVFYQPSRIVWKLILSVDAAPGGTVAVAAPSVRPVSSR